jgi:hypothetical protein
MPMPARAPGNPPAFHRMCATAAAARSTTKIVPEMMAWIAIRVLR